MSGWGQRRRNNATGARYWGPGERHRIKLMTYRADTQYRRHRATEAFNRAATRYDWVDQIPAAKRNRFHRMRKRRAEDEMRYWGRQAGERYMGPLHTDWDLLRE